jgi:(p)ppGpp synthase/HD superfamily hydrolase
MQLGPRFTDALGLANELHAGQSRKASQVPYLSHVLSVSATVLEYGGTEDVAIAALLHDVVEDCGGRPIVDLLRERFGDHVTEIVLGCSDTIEQPKPSWKQRKDRYLSHLPEASPEVLLVSAADKLHNLQSLLREERRLGHHLWLHFRAGRDGTLWYYERLFEIFQRSTLPFDLVEQIGKLVDALRERIEEQRRCHGVEQSGAPPAIPQEPSDPNRKAG